MSIDGAYRDIVGPIEALYGRTETMESRSYARRLKCDFPEIYKKALLVTSEYKHREPHSCIVYCSDKTAYIYTKDPESNVGDIKEVAWSPDFQK